MDIMRLKEFLKLIECSGFRPAAKELFLSQATLSRHIAEIETTLGKPLVIRENPPILTPAGTVFEQYARRLVALSERMSQDLGALDNTTNYLIKFHDVSTDKQLSFFFKSVHQLLKDKLIGAEFLPVSPLSPSIINAVIEHEIDIGVIEVLLQGNHVLMPASESVDFVLLPGTKQPITVFCPRTSPLSKLDSVKPHHLSSAHLVFSSTISPQDSKQSLYMFANTISKELCFTSSCSVSNLTLLDTLVDADNDVVIISGASTAALVPSEHDSFFIPKTVRLNEYRTGICLVMRKNWKELVNQINCKYNIF